VTDQTQASLAADKGDAEQPVIDQADREILRRLASRVAELAARPIEAERRKLWQHHNALHPTRPLVFCDPENGWREIITADQMQCSGTLARGWEMALRKEVFWAESMGDDRACEPFFDMGYVYSETDWGMHETTISGGDGGSYRWDAPLKSYADMDKLRVPQITVDRQATEARIEVAREVLGDSLTVRLKGRWWWSLGMTGALIRLRGLHQVLLDMYDHPAELHRLMAFLRDGTLAGLDFLEQQGLLSLNNDNTYVGSGGFGYTRELPQGDFDGEHVRTRDLWGFCESQETSTVSPALFEEFVFQYQLPILERFGLNCYGCCEPLDKRWHVVRRAPRLRRISVSAWCDFEAMAENLGDRYIYSLKPNPAHLAVEGVLDEALIRNELRTILRIARRCRVEIIMKDNHTIGKDPQHVIRWCRIAREEAEAV